MLCHLFPFFCYNHSMTHTCVHSHFANVSIVRIRKTSSKNDKYHTFGLTINYEVNKPKKWKKKGEKTKKKHKNVWITFTFVFQRWKTNVMLDEHEFTYFKQWWELSTHVEHLERVTRMVDCNWWGRWLALSLNISHAIFQPKSSSVVTLICTLL